MNALGAVPEKFSGKEVVNAGVARAGSYLRKLNDTVRELGNSEDAL